jgi:hypothetical protein
MSHKAFLVNPYRDESHPRNQAHYRSTETRNDGSQESLDGEKRMELVQ